MKTAIASPDGPDKKKFGIPKKDKKGLAKKTEYEYKSETLGNKKKPKPKSKDDGQNIRRSREEKNPHKPMDYKSPLEKKKEPQLPKNPKKDSEDNIGRKGPKDLQFEKSYKVVPNKLKTKEDLNKKDTPSTKKGKK